MFCISKTIVFQVCREDKGRAVGIEEGEGQYPGGLKVYACTLFSGLVLIINDLSNN